MLAIDNSQSYAHRPTMNKYISSFEDFFAKVFNIIDVENSSLFQIIENLKNNDIHSCDPKMISVILQDKLDAINNSKLCPKCNSLGIHNKFINKKLQTTFGLIEIKAPYLFCNKCKTFFDPYKSILNLKSGKYQYDLQKVAAKIASSVPFAEAADILKDTHGLRISQDTIHDLTNELGEQVGLEEIAPDPAVVHEIIDHIAQGKKRRPVLVFAADGAMAPIRTKKGLPQCWKENKGVRAYLVDDDHIVHLLSWHQICDKEQFFKYLQVIKGLNLFPENRVRVCCLGDGARWIWEGVETVFPSARQILDYYHCAEHLEDFVKIRFKDSALGKKWLKDTKARLFANDAKLVLSGLRRMQLEGDAAKERDSLYSYFSNNLHRLDYGKARRGGYPIGSGAIESANKFIGHVRLKRSGAWWKVDEANHVLKLRCARYNEQYDRMFAEYEARNDKGREASKPKLRVVK